jgi:S-(hydroxymethyl)glutathione dehydrogenase/alcohol dehydrogenase
MRAAVIERAGAPVRIEELSLDGPREGEVQVRMLGSGVCHSDLHVRDGDWERPGPIVLGHEGAGVVEAVGPGVDVPHVGDLVALSWYAPCLVCRECEAGRQWLCTGSPSLRHRMNDGTTRLHRGDGSDVLAYLSIGTFAEAQVVPATAAVTMPDGITPETAALIGCCVSTGVGAALKTAALRAGATVVVFGLGGVGLSVLMGARIAQAGKIVAVDRVQAKLDLATELGATDTVLAVDRATTIEAIRDTTDGGPDVAFEAIGLQETIQQAIEVLPPGGTAVLVGLTPFGVRASFDVFPFVDGSRRILGSNYGYAVAAEDFPRYARLHVDGRLPIDRLIDRQIGLDDLEDAFDRMRRGEGLRSVVVFEGGPAGN